MKKEILVLITALCFILLLHSACTKDKTNPTPTPVCGYAFGNNSDNDNMGWSGENLFASRFTLASGVSVKSISVKLAADTNFIAGIYSDNSGVPADLVTQTGVVSGTTGWNSVTITAVGLNTGVTYWLTVITQDVGMRITTGAFSSTYAPVAWSTVSSGLPADLNGVTWYSSTNEIKIYAAGCR